MPTVQLLAGCLAFESSGPACLSRSFVNMRRMVIYTQKDVNKMIRAYNPQYVHSAVAFLDFIYRSLVVLHNRLTHSFRPTLYMRINLLDTVLVPILSMF